MSLTPFERTLQRCVSHIYTQLGVIYKEAHYQRALQIELSQKGYNVTVEQHAPTLYVDSVTGARHNIYNDRTDMIVHNPLHDTRVLLELKHENTPDRDDNVAQVLRYYKNLLWTGVKIDGLYIIGFPKTHGIKCKIKRVNTNTRLLLTEESDDESVKEQSVVWV